MASKTGPGRNAVALLDYVAFFLRLPVSNLVFCPRYAQLFSYLDHFMDVYIFKKAQSSSELDCILLSAKIFTPTAHLNMHSAF